MDLRLVRHLAEAERHVALSDKHIARHLEIIDELERGGHSTLLALDVLDTYRILHASHVAHRDLIRRELATESHQAEPSLIVRAAGVSGLE